MKTNKRNRIIIIVGIVLILIGILYFAIGGFKKANIKEIAYYMYAGDTGIATKTVIFPDGKVKQYRVGFDGTTSYTPCDEWNISKKEWNSIVRSVSLYSYKILPNSIGWDMVMDAPCYYVEIITESETYKKGGYAAGFGFWNGNFRFRKIRENIEENIHFSEHIVNY